MTDKPSNFTKHTPIKLQYIKRNEKEHSKGLTENPSPAGF